LTGASKWSNTITNKKKTHEEQALVDSFVGGNSCLKIRGRGVVNWGMNIGEECIISMLARKP
jgi:hypothetical protein